MSGAPWQAYTNTTSVTSGAIGYNPTYYQNTGITTTSPGAISINGVSGTAGGYISTDSTGNINWNDNPLAYNYGAKPSVKNLTDMLKDDMVKKIVLCKSKEECKEEYGKHGLEIYESLLKEILDAGIKSEESFLSELTKEQAKLQKLKDYVSTRYSKDKELHSILLES